MKKSLLVKAAILALPLFLTVGCASNGAKSPKTTKAANNSQFSSEIQKLQQIDTVYFAFDKYNLSPKFTSILDKHAAFLKKNPSVAANIEGHADERGTAEYNIALGQRRANAVKAYLVKKGVSAKQLTTVSYGKEKPAVLGHTAEAYSKNRRAVVVY